MTSTTTERWTADAVPDQSGRVAVVTGGNTGIGFEAARVLAGRGARVILACRNEAKGQEAAGRMAGAGHPPAVDVEVEVLDLASLASVRSFAERLHELAPRLDLLINNAGVMWTPKGTTADGFDLQFGTNHLGHFALTGLVLELMLPVAGSRVVTVSSMGHRAGRIDFSDLQLERHYGRMKAYAQSKLANLMFTYELQRRLAAAGAATVAVAAHPGTARTELVRNSPSVLQVLNDRFGWIISQNAAMGALPTLRAATDPAVQGGEYYGPRGFLEQRGAPKRVDSNRRSYDTDSQRRLWGASEELTGVTYPV